MTKIKSQQLEAKYSIYTALITQTGTNAPVVTVLENTLSGPIVWTYSSVGFYVGTLASAFPEDETACLLQDSLDDTHSVIYRASDDTVEISIKTISGSPAAIDNSLFKTLVEIKIYQ